MDTIFLTLDIIFKVSIILLTLLLLAVAGIFAGDALGILNKERWTEPEHGESNYDPYSYDDRTDYEINLIEEHNRLESNPQDNNPYHWWGHDRNECPVCKFHKFQ